MAQFTSFYADQATTAFDKNLKLTELLHGQIAHLRIIRIERLDQDEQRGWLVIAEGNGDDRGY